MHENEEIELSGFLEADERFTSGWSFTLEEIAKKMLHREESKKSEDDDVIVEKETISFEKDQLAFRTVRKFMQQRRGKLLVVQAYDWLEDEMHKILRKNMRQ